MRIFFSCENLSMQNAQTTQVMELADNLEKKGNTVLVFAPGTRKYQGEKKTKIIYVPTLDLFLLRSFTYQFFLLAYFIINSFKSKPDVLFTRMGVFSVSPLLYARLLGRPHVTHFPDNIVEDMEMVNTNKIIVFGYKLVEKINCRFSEAITTTTEGIKKYLVEKYNLLENKVFILPNGANTDFFKPMDEERCRRELNLGEGKIVGFVGGLAPWQGLKYLIDAAPKIIEKYPDTRFIIVGEGSLREELLKQTQQKKATDKFKFIGTVPYNQVPLYMNSFDVCAAPFIKKRNIEYGLSPLKINEYAACGKPIVASRIPGIEFIETEKIGLLVEPEDSEALAKEIINLLTNDKLRVEMGANAREYTVKNRSWAAISDQLENVFLEVRK